jgi:hypothetical protein
LGKLAMKFINLMEKQENDVGEEVSRNASRRFASRPSIRSCSCRAGQPRALTSETGKRRE